MRKRPEWTDTGEDNSMMIIGYCVCRNRQYVVFGHARLYPDGLKITDGFHDRLIREGNVERYRDYRWVDRKEVDLKKIIDRLRGTRPWHPLLELLRKECDA